MAGYAAVVWTTGDVITETKLDNMVSNDQSEDAHAANGMIMNNNVAYSAKQAGGATVDILKKNASDQSLIGENSLRAGVFVAIPRVEALNTNPADTNWHDLDVTALTHALCYAVCGTVSIQDTSGATIVAYMRTNGDADAPSDTTRVTTTLGTNNSSNAGFQQEVDTGQILEWAVSSADADALIVNLTGYWRYVD